MSELVRLRGKIYFTKYILCSGERGVGGGGVYEMVRLQGDSIL